MTEPERLDEREPIPEHEPVSVLATEDPAPETTTVDEEPTPRNPLDAPILPDPTPQPENYHVSIWETPETFVCLRCAAKGLTLAEVTYHLDAAHGEAAVPTLLAAQYTPPATPPATGEEALHLMRTRTAQAEDVAPEEVPTPVPQEEPV